MFKSFVRLPVATLALLSGLSTGVQAQTYAAYDGRKGYQELPLSAHTYYLAFHGDRSTSGPWVDAAWAARAAQLCLAKGSEVFVALRYVEEPVQVGDTALALHDPDAPRVVRVAAPIYIPMFIPSGPRNASVDAPSKIGPVRCLASGADLREPARAVRAKEVLDAARRAGISVP